MRPADSQGLTNDTIFMTYFIHTFSLLDVPLNCTYTKAIHHCFEAYLEASLKNASPARAIVGAMDSGPMKRIKKPIRPVKPITTCNTEAIIIAP